MRNLFATCSREESIARLNSTDRLATVNETVWLTKGTLWSYLPVLWDTLSGWMDYVLYLPLQLWIQLKDTVSNTDVVFEQSSITEWVESQKEQRHIPALGLTLSVYNLAGEHLRIYPPDVAALLAKDALNNA